MLDIRVNKCYTYFRNKERGEKMKEYRYATRLRPAGIGCQPMSGMLRIETVEEPKTGCWSIIVYNRPLTAEELYSYEMKEL